MAYMNRCYLCLGRGKLPVSFTKSVNCHACKRRLTYFNPADAGWSPYPESDKEKDSAPLAQWIEQ